MKLKGKSIAVLVEDEYEDLELWYPVIRMMEEGAKVTIIHPGTKKEYIGKHGLPASKALSEKWFGYEWINIENANAKDYDAVIVPGGWAPDKLRRYSKILDFVRTVYEHGIVAPICHGPSVAVSAGILEGHTASCSLGIKDDVEYAGAKFIDKSVVISKNIITSRHPGDLPDFCRAIINELAK